MRGKCKPLLVLFGWPSRVGGSETKLAATAALLAGDFDIVWVPNDDTALRERPARSWIAAYGMRAAAWDAMPHKLDGVALAMCNIPFLTGGRAVDAKRRGLRIAWGGEMMWAIPGEIGAVAGGLVDVFLFTGEAQHRALAPVLLTALGGDLNSEIRKAGNDVSRFPDFLPSKFPAAHPAHGGTSGVIRARAGSVRWATVGNYVCAEAFPFRDRSRGKAGTALTVGRLSRADWVKYPADFPRSYEGLGLRGARFRVMAWSRELAGRWPRWRPDARWDLLPAMAEEPVRFLQSLDLYVYDMHARFSESWGRACVEAMLTGAVPLIPADPRHHLHMLVPHGVAGFHCASRAEWRTHARALQADAGLRLRMSRAAAEFAREELCDAGRHRAVWRAALTEG